MSIVCVLTFFKLFFFGSERVQESQVRGLHVIGTNRLPQDQTVLVLVYVPTINSITFL